MQSRPAVWVAAALAVGITAAGWLRPHPALCLAALAPLVGGLLAGRRSAALLLAALAAFGALRCAYVQTAGRGNLSAWEGQQVSLVGTVVSEPELRPSGGAAYVVAAEAVGGHPARGRVRITQRYGQQPAFGERIAVSGRLAPPLGPRHPGGFDEAAYLARQSVYLVMESGPPERLGPGALDPFRRAAVAVRLRLEGVLRQALPEREAALMAGLLFGSRSDLPDDVSAAFRATGVFHLLAVSGGNVALLVVPLLWLLRRAGLGRAAASALVIPAVLFFVFLTGASPSVLRAGLMAILVLAGDVLGRERDALNTLGAAAALLLVLLPGLLFDLGFQLSVAATLGILLLAGPIQRWLALRLARGLPEGPARLLAEGLSVTLAAQALVEPLSLHAFGVISPVAPLANLLVVPFVGLLVPFGLAAVTAGLVLPPAVWLLGLVGRWALAVLVYGVKALGSLPLAQVAVGHLPPGGVLLWYGAVLLAASPALRRALTGRLEALWRRLRAAPAGVCAAGALTLLAALGAGLSWRLALAGPPDRLQLVFLDVGQGDAILVRGPDGTAALVDAGVAYEGRSGSGFDAGAEVVVPYLRRAGVRRLEYLVLTHPDVDHVGGAEAVLRRVPVGQVRVSTAAAPEPSYARALAAAAELGVPVRQAREGDVLPLGEGVWLQVLGPPEVPLSGSRSDDNANCVAVRVVYRRVAALLACDLEADAEARLVDRGYDLSADVLKVAHHGSRFSTTERFLRAVSPRVAVVSAGRGNPFGHPHGEVLERLRAAGAEVWRTDQHGTVTLWSDGFRVWAEGTAGRPGDAERRPPGLRGRRWLGAW
ncbi:competence protein ComEC [Symbiobacterium terraclitae]|uniref:Competence protein ComEC n=1 Tax=Symbiobacterium terraclitae TaxID=557451 RepID=A0ABS4JPE6_9FIRM|nr:competence protein ComEC [Symbiobacterium terraclitae]